MTHPFDEALALEACDDPGDGDGLFEVRLDERFWGPRAPHGGYLGALALEAMVRTVADRDLSPRSITLHFPSPVTEGTARIGVHIERSGKRVAMVSAWLTQGDAARSAVLARAVFGRTSGVDRASAPAMPPLPPPTECPRQKVSVPIDERFELRIGVGAPPFSGAAEARYGGWARMVPPRPIDAPALVALADAWWPAYFPTLTSPRQAGLAPTLDLTVQLHRTFAPTDADGWVVMDLTCDHMEEGFFSERSSIWSADGELLAQSLQRGLRIERDGAATGSPA